MMFVRENMNYLRKHYVKLACVGREEHLHDLARLELQYFPPLRKEEEWNNLDVGQDDHALDF